MYRGSIASDTKRYDASAPEIVAMKAALWMIGLSIFNLMVLLIYVCSFDFQSDGFVDFCVRVYFAI